MRTTINNKKQTELLWLQSAVIQINNKLLLCWYKDFRDYSTASSPPISHPIHTGLPQPLTSFGGLQRSGSHISPPVINILLLGPPKSWSVFSHRLIVRKRWGDWGLILSGKSQKKGVSGEKVWAEIGFLLLCNGWVALETQPWTWNLLNLTNFPLQSQSSSRWCSAPSA